MGLSSLKRLAWSALYRHSVSVNMLLVSLSVIVLDLNASVYSIMGY